MGGREVLAKRVENALSVGVPLIGSGFAIARLVQGEATWIDLSAFVLFYSFVGIGVGLGLHRFFSHKSFAAHPIFASILGAAGSMAFQGNIIRWVADHRRHHAHTDRDGDLHSPVVDPWGAHAEGVRGWWHAHMGWMFDRTATDISVYGRGLENDPIVAFFTRTYFFWLALSLALPALYGYVLGGPDAVLGALLFGGFLRISVLHQVIWSVNSFGHMVGEQNFNNGDDSTNNRLLALITFGDGWHNNHHRYPRSYRHGLKPGEIDVNGFIVDSFERLGVVKDVVRIPPERIARDLRESSAPAPSVGAGAAGAFAVGDMGDKRLAG